MKVFISWSGPRSKAAATAIRDWLPLVLHYAEPWMSETDIESEARGLNKIAEELEGRNYGVVCVTAENVRAPWINFEAGALSKSIKDGLVVPLLLDLEAKDIPPPLGSFRQRRLKRTELDL